MEWAVAIGTVGCASIRPLFVRMGLADPPAFLYGGDGSRSVRAADNSPLLYPMRCLSVPWILSLDRREAKPKQARGPGQGIQCYTLDILLLTRCTERDLSTHKSNLEQFPIVPLSIVTF